MAIKLKNLHVLIVEDIGPMRDLMAAVLKAQGIGTISHASDGQSGYEMFCRRRPDILITDWLMPGMDGLELTHHIRTRADSPDQAIPIIMMTGYASPPKISKARDSGINEILVKPFSATEVSKRIMNVIKQPRDFIIAPNFKGPDRRRKKDANDPNGDNKRSSSGKPPNVEIIKANHVLQAKVGLGNLEDEALLRSQSVLEKNNINFTPIATEFLKQFREALDITKTEDHITRKSIERVINPVMQIKANARIFKYALLGDLAAIMLNFLEGMNEMDSDALAIVEAHYLTLSRMVQDKMQGDGGPNGQSFADELEAACRRYVQSRIIRQKKAMEQAMADQKS